MALDPHSFEAHYFYGRVCFGQGKLERALAHFERALEIKPDDCQVQLLMPQMYRSLGRFADEERALRRGISLAEREWIENPDNPRPVYLGATALAKLGEMARAREWAFAIDPDDFFTQYNVACMYTMLSDFDAAFDLLDKLLPRANDQTKAWARHDSDFAPLHGHPRWQKILALLN